MPRSTATDPFIFLHKLMDLPIMLCPLLCLAMLNTVGEATARDGLPVSEGLRRDAVIRAIDFVDADSGWAVGERGALWHTEDGGAHWHLQPTPVSCHLYSVCFVDAQTGWAAGGFTEPYTHLSRGVLLKTDDGGRRWSVWTTDPLPKIKKIKFSNRRRGIALTAASPLYPHGLLVTDDGGRSWSTLQGELASGWKCADFHDAETGCVAGSGQRGLIRKRQLRSLHRQAENDDLSAWHCLCMGSDQLGYALDTSGILHVTHNGGERWQQRAPLPVPTDFTPQVIEAQGRHVWIAGTPGDQILYSENAGLTWSQQTTEQAFPIWDIHFIDSKIGWAGGEFGSILFTDNGGRDWKIQRQSRQRAAVLGVFATAHSVPLEAFAQLSAAEGYSSSVTLFGFSPIAPSVPLDDPMSREREAILWTGVNAVDQAFVTKRAAAGSSFVSPFSTSMARHHATESVAFKNDIAEFESHLIRQIGLYRPDIIVTHPATQRVKDPLGFEINQAVLRAVESAAATDRPQVSAWQVRKVYASLPAKKVGSLSLSTRQWMVTLGGTLAEQVRGARTLLTSFPVANENVLSFALLLNNLPQGRGGSQFFGGMHLAAGGPARRKLVDHPAATALGPQRRGDRADILRAILASAGAGQPSLAAWRAQIHRAASELPPHQAAQVLIDVATEHLIGGQAPLAAETLALLIDHFPNDPLAPAAWSWLVTYRASGEFHHRFGQAETDAARLASTKPGGGVTSNAAGIAAGDQLERTAPALFADPRIQFPLAAAYRREGEMRRAERIALMLARAPWLESYSKRSSEELILSGDRTAGEAAPQWIAVAAKSKPYLDGRLDEPCWQRSAAESIELKDRNTTTELSTRVRVCFDAQYLYFGIESEKSPEIAYEKAPAARRRDASVEAHDRVEIFIDIDRDYATSYRLTVDSRGCTHDQLWMDASWDPLWFVAATETASHWRCELAIPLDALSEQNRTEDRVWACGVQRIIPGGAFQSWTGPASPQVDPIGFGHLQLPASID